MHYVGLILVLAWILGVFDDEKTTTPEPDDVKTKIVIKREAPTIAEVNWDGDNRICVSYAAITHGPEHECVDVPEREEDQDGNQDRDYNQLYPPGIAGSIESSDDIVRSATDAGSGTEKSNEFIYRAGEDTRY